MKQNQTSGSGSVNLQAGSVTFQGLSYSDARQIAVDVMRSELVALSGVAEEVAMQRMEAYADQLMERLSTSPQLTDALGVPAVQFAVRDIHRLYARRGNEELGQLGLDLLVDLIAARDDDFRTVVLSDAAKILFSLTTGQIDSMTVLFVMTSLEAPPGDSLEDWAQSTCARIEHVLPTATRSNAELDYIVGTGCATFDTINYNFGSWFTKRHSDLTKKFLSDDSVTSKERFSRGTAKILPRDIIEERLASLNPTLKRLIGLFNRSHLNRMNLRIVGRAISAANLKRKIPTAETPDDFWQNP